MRWDPADFSRQLAAAAEAFDRPEVARLAEELIAHLRSRVGLYPEADALRVLGILRRKRHFELLQRVADAFLLSGQRSPQALRHYAQALIEGGPGRWTAAVAVLEDLVAGTTAHPEENAEARGLLGRVYKQLYLAGGPAARRRRFLERSVASYLDVYRSAPEVHLWHGINAVALLIRGREEGMALDGGPDPGAIAREILETIEDLDREGTIMYWELATAAEAAVALGRTDKALWWILRYIDAPGADAFELASTLRQLTDVWRLDVVDDPGAKLLPLLRSQLLQREGGQVEVKPAELTASVQRLDRQDTVEGGLEKVFGFEKSVALRWYRTGLERCSAIGRVESRTGKGFGTGFLVRGGDLHPRFGSELLLLTNAHVLSNDPRVQSTFGARHTEAAVVTFEVLGSEHQVAEQLWTSPPWELDATLVRLTPAVAAPGALFSLAPQPIPSADGKLRVYVIGHPAGRSLEISLHDSLLLDCEDPKIHYRTPTEPGSSGSPVFNEDWDLVALHHAGRDDMPRLKKQPGTYAANEGIWIYAIINKLREVWGA
ncbi:MAG TPA: serine protease [Thermoanaerobaculia bacterium]|nr:serine protease [Thermoanaerobaculia bacterium]